MKGKSALIGLGLLGLSVAATVTAHDRDRDHRFRVATILRSIEEVPSVSSPASGYFKATIDTANQTISYELSYKGIETPLQAHIHLGQNHVNGGISVFLCSNVGTPPAGTPACPAAPATIVHTLSAESIIGPTAQGLDAGEFEELAAAIRKGVTYANVHSARFPGGEIRGQIDRDDRK